MSINYFTEEKILNKDLQTFNEKKGVEIYYSGGGNWHFFYKGFLINSDNVEIEHNLENYELSTVCYFGYWDGYKQYGFHQEFEMGIELLEMLDYKKLREV